ncbi:MAG: radical SAM protein [Thioploca sp.]|nr:radical SAM protein [Thioploca sp.]
MSRGDDYTRVARLFSHTRRNFSNEGQCACAGSSMSKTLSAWLHITDKCNLRCDYCYLPHVHANMPVEIGYAAIQATVRSALIHHYPQIKLKYAGGEPLLNFSLITELHCYAQYLTKQHGLTLEGVVLSNATLLNSEMLAQLQALDLRLMISLDGLGIAHDQQRSYANGCGSVDKVIHGIELAMAHGLVPAISITVSGRNAAHLSEVVAWILKRDLPFSFNFYRENDLSSSFDDLKLEEDKIIAGMLAAYKVIEENLSKRSLLTSLVDRVNLAEPHLYSCNTGSAYLVFDHQGQISKCQMQMDKPVAVLPIKDPLALIRADQTGIQNLSVLEKEECCFCEWKDWCAGGCPLDAYRATGRYNVHSPNCVIYKALCPEVIRLEKLRTSQKLS